MIRTRIEGARPIIRAPRVNSTSDNIIVGFLPQLSATGPAMRDPTAAPN
jgi:hypothetical protein